MKRCAFLTFENPAGFVIDDPLAYQSLRDLGWHLESIPWQRSGIVWSAYDAVVIRSTWDYVERFEAFLAVLSAIEGSGARLFNSLDLVRWNMRKTYLRDLADRGVPIVPTVWRERLRSGELMSLFEELGSKEAILKPVVGAGAEGAFRVDKLTAPQLAASIETCYANRALMAQPFLPAVIAEGEFSLFYFNGVYSHAVLKTPKATDFRVQEEHGGHIRAVEADADLRAAGEAALRALGEAPLYARADFVRSDDGASFWLMELELIEPSLYLRMDEEAPSRLARAIHQRAS
jgi:glutathione synthase/RimK-type ligase-like ATP-grasp enzyme